MIASQSSRCARQHSRRKREAITTTISPVPKKMRLSEVLRPRLGVHGKNNSSHSQHSGTPACPWSPKSLVAHATTTTAKKPHGAKRRARRHRAQSSAMRSLRCGGSVGQQPGRTTVRTTPKAGLPRPRRVPSNDSRTDKSVLYRFGSPCYRPSNSM